jgi:hypothetical protein
MELDEFRREMESYRRQADEEANRRKDSVWVEKLLLQLYGRFDASERLMADKVFAEWVLSQDEATRFDALVMIRHFKIVTALPALRQLAERLSGERSPGAPFERDKVERLIAAITPASPA